MFVVMITPMNKRCRTDDYRSTKENKSRNKCIKATNREEREGKTDEERMMTTTYFR